ncbi:MAG: hypothetical protein R3272_03165 [Candidatus Promineifilaceae bacterium]|nr:hypothetical protein [Candidatus Promineifilaceae bacterium]
MLLRLLLSLVAVPLSALAGNLVGDRLRARFLNEPVHQWRLVHETREGQKVIGLNPRPTTFVPALLAALVGRPGWLFAFLGGLAASFLFGNTLERPFWALVDRQLVLRQRRSPASS